MTHFILMLTRDDRTVTHAQDAYEQVRDTPVTHIGFKDIGLPTDQLAALTERMRADGKVVMLEVVSTSREDELRSVQAAIDIGVDYVLGGRHVHDAVKLLSGTTIKYFPFCGHTVGHPTRLTGTIDQIVADARLLAAVEGVSGLDLLSYRFDGDVETLTRRVVQSVKLPVIAAGSIDSVERIRAMCDAGVWGFTIGSAIFGGVFIQDMLRQQVQSVVKMEGVTS